MSDNPIDIEAGLDVSQYVTDSGDLKLTHVEVYEHRVDTPTGPIAEFGSLADAMMFVWAKTNLEPALYELQQARVTIADVDQRSDDEREEIERLFRAVTERSITIYEQAVEIERLKDEVPRHLLIELANAARATEDRNNENIKKLVDVAVQRVMTERERAETAEHERDGLLERLARLEVSG